MRPGDHGLCGIGCERLLSIPQARCEGEGARLVFETGVQDGTVYIDADLIIVNDDLSSRIRTKYVAMYQPDIDTRRYHSVQFGTCKLFEALIFALEETEHDWFWTHTYYFDGKTFTFIVEVPEETWRAAGLETTEKEDAIAYYERPFVKYFDGNKLISSAAHLRDSVQ